MESFTDNLKRAIIVCLLIHALASSVIKVRADDWSFKLHPAIPLLDHEQLNGLFGPEPALIGADPSFEMANGGVPAFDFSYALLDFTVDIDRTLPAFWRKGDRGRTMNRSDDSR